MSDNISTNAEPPQTSGAADKVVPLQELAAVLRRRKQNGEKVVLCHGVFDLLHPGHIQHLEEAASLGDVLVVTVTPDALVNKGPGRPAFPHRLRMRSLAALEQVDYVALSERATAVHLIELLEPDIYVKGSEYEDAANDLTGKIRDEVEAVARVGGRVHYSGGEVFSSSTLINRHLSLLSPAAELFLEDFRRRFSATDILSQVRLMSELDVLVVGDIILDQYTYCEPLAKSPREMIVAARYQSEEQFAGGSLAVANHLAGLCRSVTLVATLGMEDAVLEFIKKHMRPNVKLELVRTPDRPTVVKRRFVDGAFLVKMFEIQFVDDRPHVAEVEMEILERIAQARESTNLCVVSDFGHGVVTTRGREFMSAHPGFLAVNSQTNSANLMFNPITLYPRADYGCIHELELRFAAGSKHGPLEQITSRLKQQLGARRFMVTRGKQGTYLMTEDGGVCETPSLASRVVDRVGAGDTVFSATAPLAYLNVAPEVLSFVGNCAGALAVQTVCNRDFIDLSILSKYIHHLMK
ncbi:MAG: PfkB family carbohydrate kinase [Candidatus Xenobia bacterium]